jgi:hypothetical protein
VDKIRLWVILPFFLFSIPVFAADTSILNKTSGGPAYGEGFSVQQTDDGGYIIAGTKYSYEPTLLSQIIWLIKTDANGNKVWDRIFGGPRNDIGFSVQQTSDRGYVVAGFTESFGSGEEDGWLIKTDADGNEVWNRTFGGPRRDWVHSVRQTSDGGYIVTGSMYSYNAAHLSQMAWLIKTDANGNRVWDKIFGGPRDDWGNSVQQTSDKGYIITGATKSYGERGNSALWLIKTDSDGDNVWDKTFSGPSDAIGYSIQQTSDGGYIVSGSKIPFSGRAGETWVIKTDANGNETWDKTLSGSSDDVGASVQQTSDGGYIVIGSKVSSSGASQSIWLTKIDDKGNEMWDRAFGASGWNEGKSVKQTSDGGYILTGSTYAYGSGGKGSAVWLIKTDADGNEVWNRTFE